jgi:hypothetical protein
MSIGPGFVFEGDLYLIAGDSDVARQIIYRLHQNQAIPVIFAPFETTDQRPAGAVVSGTTPVIGWAFADAVNVSKVEVLLDDVTDGTASYGEPRPDVQMADPDSPLNVGFSYSLNTARYLDGPHRIYVRVTDSGNIAIAPSVPIVFSNAASDARREASASHATNIDKGTRGVGKLWTIRQHSLSPQ